MIARSKTLLLALVIGGASALSVACEQSQLARLGGGSANKDKDESDEDDEDDEEEGIGTGTGSSSTSAKALDEATAIAFLKENCGSCHGPGADLHSTWPLPGDDLSSQTLESMDSAATAYQAIVHRFAKAPETVKPAPMPPQELDDAKRAQLEGLIYWFRLTMPSVVEEAESVYGETAGISRDFSVDLNYACKKRASTRNYAFRLWNQALGRPPSAAELSELIPAGELDSPVSAERRAALAAVVTEGAQQSSFLAYGLKVFAQRVAGSGAIEASADFGITEPMAVDLREEFYRLLLRYAVDTPYKDILLMPKVFASQRTAALYDGPDTPCLDPGAGAWVECSLDARRANYFGTYGYLRSAPSSFLASNNNYKRGGDMHAVIRGERLMAQTDGPPGVEAAPLPACLATKDTRAVLNDPADATKGAAPRGATAVPRHGSVCQSCHVQQYLGIASYVFRPFDEGGRLYTQNAIAETGPYAAAVKTAIEPGIILKDYAGSADVDVTPGELRGLLAENEAGQAQCIQDRAGATVKEVRGIKDLAEYMIGDGRVLARGLARYMPRALGNQPVTNQEILAAISKAFADGGGKLMPAFKAYFQTESFACAVEGGE
jgi:hypothetical protein